MNNRIQFVLQYIQADVPTNKTLSTLTVQILQFQEDTLGKNVVKPSMTKIPVSFASTKYIPNFKNN